MATTTAPSKSSIAVTVAELAYKAGFRGSALTTATAVGLAESSGNPTAISGDVKSPSQATDVNGGSYGIWQINGSHAGVIGPSPSNGGPLPPSSWIQQMFNPQTNANEAFTVSGGGSNFTPWSTYTSGAYQGYLSQAQAAASQVSGNPPSGAVNTSGLSGSLASSAQAQLTASTSGNATCSQSAGIKTPGIIGSFGSLTILNGCQLKALKGGLLAVAGGLLMLVGAVAIISKTGIGKKVAEASGATVVVRAVSRGRTSGGSSAPSRSEYEGSPDRRGSASHQRPARSVSADEAYDMDNPPF